MSAANFVFRALTSSVAFVLPERHDARNLSIRSRSFAASTVHLDMWGNKP